LRIVADLIDPGDFVVLVVPIDKAAPKGRLILPQQQTIRDILEADATAIVVKEYELRETLEQLGRRPRLVITDSQVFAKVSADTPDDILLTSFSILFARYKGNLETAVRGARAIETLQDGDRVLIAEGCTHHRQCDDIGSVKLPRWIRAHTGKELEFCFCSGTEFPEDLSSYKMIVHCGGCMLNEREMKYRLSCAEDQGVPITNYGILIAYMQGILERSLRAFPHIAMLLEDQ
ncbi:MAG: [FeFe] hydrogenase H-cluster maturation GTPase HydF, partial [Oscillospiraceae bacterium]|nr:[FeFe] hydrogenase H-cluster maturation GTPase HydF [Oscillospiraceae bacterium]